MNDPIARLRTALADRYRLERELGQGGMATVYLAEDLKHGRKVAIKVLRPELAAIIGAGRFLREIATIATLQHPHILGLIDSGEVEGTAWYVMPFVDGESLRERLEREKQLPVEEALRISSEVAAALDYAHRQGVIHRDIKPENVLLHDGSALVADFGIALAVNKAGGTRMTETGMSLGTPHYMSPEQAMGEREITARSDVYGLGAMTYEMLVGDPPFTGSTAQAIVAKVVTESPPPIRARRRTVPEHVENAVLVALEKLPADRFGSAAEFAEALNGRRTVTRAAAPRTWQASRPRLVAGVGIGLAIAFVAGWLLHGLNATAPPRPPVRRAIVPMSPEFDVRGSDVAVSADGSTVVATDNLQVMVRRLDRVDITPVPNGDDASQPFLSADGRRIGFRRGTALVVQGIDGSNAVSIPAAISSGAFDGEDQVVAADSNGLLRFDLRTGAREEVVRRTGAARLWQPIILPGSGHILVSEVPGDLNRAVILDVDPVSRRVDTLPVGAALRPQYSRGHLYFARPNGGLYAVPFDARGVRVTGDPVAIGDNAVVARLGAGLFGVGSGVIAFGASQRTQIVAIDSSGHRQVLLGEPGAFHNPRVSPDGRRILVDRDLGPQGGRDVWVLDLDTGTLSRLTAVGDAHDAVWKPDGQHITYISFSTAGGPLVTVSAEGASGTELIAERRPVNPGTWLPDGRTLLAGVSGGPDQGNIVAFRDGALMDTILDSRFDEHSPAISPDGRWLAYTSNETGRIQVYVRTLDGRGGRALVSEGNGEEPVWSRVGSHLLYIEHQADGARVIAAGIEAGSPPRVASRTVLIDHLSYQPVGNHANWDVMPDGRMVFIEPVGGTELVLVFDWAPEGGPRR